MEEMHFFKESQREEIPSPDFNEPVTVNLLLDFLCDICKWADTAPYSSDNIEKNGCSLYVLFRDISFSSQDFWQTFGGYLIALYAQWKIDIFGTELSTQETVELSLDRQDNTFYAVQKTISGRYADNISSLCLRIQCADAEKGATLSLLCKNIDWQSGILVVGWELREIFEREHIPWLHQNSCYCYGNVSEDQKKKNCLDALKFPQKVNLWLQFLENRFDYTELEWLYDRISEQDLNDHTEWELALYSAMNRLNYTLKISESEFELFDGKGERRYFSFNSGQNAQKAFLKLLFPVNLCF